MPRTLRRRRPSRRPGAELLEPRALLATGATIPFTFQVDDPSHLFTNPQLAATLAAAGATMTALVPGPAIVTGGARPRRLRA